MIKTLLLFGLSAILFAGCNDSRDKQKFSGSWVRSDGGYTFEITVADDGETVAKYFNPSPIHVKAAVFKKEGDKNFLHIVFDDHNYRGSYYLLTHDKDRDILEGKYFQITAQEYFPVSFNRVSTSRK